MTGEIEYKIQREDPQMELHEQHVEWILQAASRPCVVPIEQFEHAWQVAREAAHMLKERFGATRVRAFGSLLHPDRFDGTSDVDLAVEGLDLSRYWEAQTQVLYLDDEVIVDLVDRGGCSSAVWQHVEQEGVDL